jgi:hypothetical protein
MKETKSEALGLSRRNMLKQSTAFLVGGAVTGAVGAYAATPKPGKIPAAPPLPWKWVKLDPLEAGRRAYRSYLENKG